MYPNQQPSQPPQSPPPPTPGGYGPQPVAPQAPSQYSPQPLPQQPYAQQPVQPGYGPQPTPTYAVDYLDQIAPPPPKGKFLSGGFGKAVIALGILFVLAVSLIIAFSGQKRTADLETIAIQLDNLQLISKNTQKNLKSGELLATNSNYQIWIASADRDAYTLLTQAEVKKTDMDKKMIASQKTASAALTKKFDDAKLNANLDRVYAREMAYQAQLLITSYSKMSKKSQAKAIRDYAANAVKNLTPIQKSFAGFDGSSS